MRAYSLTTFIFDIHLPLSYVLGDFRRIVHNEANCGWIFRAKDAKSTEGGIAAGYGHLDSPSLV